FARRHELNAQTLDIPVLVRGMGEMLERSLGPSVLIETRFPLNLPSIKTDPNQLEIALLNLMVNARDAMPQGGPIIVAARSAAIGEGQKLRPGSYVCLSVTDMAREWTTPLWQRRSILFYHQRGGKRDWPRVAHGPWPGPRIRRGP